MLAVYLQYTRRQQKTQYQQPECDTKGREKWPFPGRTVTILRYQRSADGLRARSSRPSARAGVLAAQRAASVGAGLRNRAPAQRPGGPLTGSGAEVQSGSDGPTPATRRAPIAVTSPPPPRVQSMGAAGSRTDRARRRGPSRRHWPSRAGGAERAAGRQPRPGVLGWIAAGPCLRSGEGCSPCGRKAAAVRGRACGCVGGRGSWVAMRR